MQTDMDILAIVGMIICLAVLFWVARGSGDFLEPDESSAERYDGDDLTNELGIREPAGRTDGESWRPTASVPTRHLRGSPWRVDAGPRTTGMFRGHGRRAGTICWITGETRENCDCPDCKRRRRGSRQ